MKNENRKKEKTEIDIKTITQTCVSCVVDRQSIFLPSLKSLFSIPVQKWGIAFAFVSMQYVTVCGC
jgi:hypothetical protein